MIVRILGEGQWEVAEGALPLLNSLDDAVEQAVAAGDQAQLAAALRELLTEVRVGGTPIADDQLLDSDLILPSADASLDEVRALLSESDEGLIPN